MLFSSLIFASNTEKPELENTQRYRIRIQGAGLLNSDIPGTTETISFEYAFYKNISIGSSLGRSYYDCKSILVLNEDECIENKMNYKEFYGDVYFSINLVHHYKYIRTGFIGGVGIISNGSYTSLPFINFFFGVKFWKFIDLTASLGWGKSFTLQAGINF
jgi:hypothetical protein